MNSRLTSSLLLLAALSASAFVPLSAAPTTRPAIACSVDVVNLDPIGRDQIRRGTIEADVLHRMGAPFEKLSPNVWLYWGYHTRDNKVADEQGCRGMLVTFANGVVTDLKFVNRPAATIIATNLKHGRDALVATNR